MGMNISKRPDLFSSYAILACSLYLQRVRTHAAQGGDTPKDMPKTGNRRRKDHVRHHNDMPAHVRQYGTEPVRKTVKSALGDLTHYSANIQKFE